MAHNMEIVRGNKVVILIAVENFIQVDGQPCPPITLTASNQDYIIEIATRHCVPLTMTGELLRTIRQVCDRDVPCASCRERVPR